MSKEYSKSIFQAIQNHLAEHKLRFFPLEEDGVILFDMHLNETVSTLNYEILVGETAFTAYVVFPLIVNPKNQKAMRKVAEYLHRINFSIRYGCFEFDYDDGSIRYKLFVDCGDSLPGEGTLDRSIAIPYMMYEKYGKGIPMILYTDADPEALFEAASSNQDIHDEPADDFDEDSDEQDDEWDPSMGDPDDIPTVEQMLEMMGVQKQDKSDDETEDSQEDALTKEEIHDQFSALYGLLGGDGHPGEPEAEGDGEGDPGDAGDGGSAE